VRFRLWGRRLDDFADEVRAHLELEVDALVAAGMSSRAARVAARRRFGNALRLQEHFAESRAAWWLDRLLNDFTYAIRTLRNASGFTITTVASLALGIGFNTALFTLVYSVFMRPLPVRDAGRLVSIHQELRGVGREDAGSPYFISLPEYRAYNGASKALEGMVAFADIDFADSGGGSVSGLLASCNYFSVLRVTVAIGRGLDRGDCSEAGQRPVVVLSDKLSQERFGGGLSALGQSLVLHGQHFTVVGVTEPGFRGTEMRPVDAWIPFTMQPAVTSDRSWLEDPNIGWLNAVARLRWRKSIADVEAELATAARQLDAVYPGRATSILVDRAALVSGPDIRQVSPAIAGVALLSVLVLLMACLNVMNLLLARLTARQRAIAVSLALGAPRTHIISRLLAECVLLALLGAAAGLSLALWIPALAVRSVSDSDLHINFGVDGVIFAYGFAVSLATILVFGLLPAFRATRVNLAASIRGERGAIGGTRGESRMRQSVVILQLAGSLVLLIVAILLSRGYARLAAADPGFETKNVFAVSLHLGQAGYDTQRAADALDSLEAALRKTPGVRGVALARSLPLASRNTFSISTERGRPGFGHVEVSIAGNAVSSSYFATLGIRLLHGSGLTGGAPQPDSALPIVVSAATARTLWQTEDALGRRLSLGDSRFVVTGVADNVRNVSLNATDDAFIYMPASTTDPRDMLMLVRGEPNAPMAKRVNAIAHRIDGDLLLTVVPFERAIGQVLRPSRLLVLLIVAMSALAATLALIGIYGLVSYGVALRRGEFGVRLAFGATPWSIVRLVLSQTGTTAFAAIILGLLLAAGVVPFLQRLLSGHRPGDPVGYLATALGTDRRVLAGSATLLVVGAMLAAFVPARRASRLNPALTLRTE
jgi:putative ABC transport system permease protein